MIEIVLSNEKGNANAVKSWRTRCRLKFYAKKRLRSVQRGNEKTQNAMSDEQSGVTCHSYVKRACNSIVNETSPECWTSLE